MFLRLSTAARTWPGQQNVPEGSLRHPSLAESRAKVDFLQLFFQRIQLALCL